VTRAEGPLGATLALARTQYLELIRQPVFGVVLAFGLALVALSPALAVFSIGRAEALVLDLGASALLFFSVFLAAVAVGGGAAERLADGTSSLLLTRPIGPTTLLAGQLLGAGVALIQVGLILGCVLLWTVRNGPDRIHWGVAGPFLVWLGLSLAWGIRSSLARRSFQSAALTAATALILPAFAVSRHLAGDLSPLASAVPAHPVGPSAAALAILAALPFAGLSLALATRLGATATATLTLLAFILASLVQGPLAPPPAEGWGIVDPRQLSLLLPDLQLYWIGDAAYAGREVPADYVASVALYSVLYAGGALGVGGFLLAGRELGRDG
jgi:hypothetical protein